MAVPGAQMKSYSWRVQTAAQVCKAPQPQLRTHRRVALRAAAPNGGMPNLSTITPERRPVAEILEPVTALQPVELHSAEQVLPQQSQLKSLDVPLPTSPQQEQQDLNRAAGVAAVTALVAILVETQKPFIASNQDLAMALVFIMGYAGIIVEDFLGLNKAGVALLMAAALWSIRADASPEVLSEASEALSDVSEVIFFLIGAMTIVEVVDSHQGFKLITELVRTRSKTALLWLVGGVTFFMSSVLDNLTTTIVMVSLLQRLCPDEETRRFLGAVVVIAANAGGAWTPIGDVTTTMLWVGGQITTLPTLRDLVIPSAVSLLVPMAAMTAFAPEVQGEMKVEKEEEKQAALAPRGKLVLGMGLGALLLVPAFKSITGLPPYLGMLASLGFLWAFVDALHFGEERRSLSVAQALKRIDTEGVLFFLGVLMAVGSLNAAGILKELATWLDSAVGNPDAVAAVIGLASAVVDNVPLVAATMGMYDMTTHPPDDQLWQLIAYAAGTGGSLLIIGSASGVALMGLEQQAKFGWYLQRITPWALLGYFAGLGTYVAINGMSA